MSLSSGKHGERLAEIREELRYSPIGAAADDIRWLLSALEAAEAERDAMTRASEHYHRAMVERDREREAAEADARQYREANHHASYFLTPNQGEPRDPVLAQQWLRTAWPKENPDHVDAATLPRGPEMGRA